MIVARGLGLDGAGLGTLVAAGLCLNTVEQARPGGSKQHRQAKTAASASGKRRKAALVYVQAPENTGRPIPQLPTPTAVVKRIATMPQEALWSPGQNNALQNILERILDDSGARLADMVLSRALTRARRRALAEFDADDEALAMILALTVA